MSGLRVERRDLERAFGSVGRVESALVGSTSATITFRDAKAAREAVRRFHGGQLNDHTINVYFEGEEPPRPRGGRTSGGGRSRTPPPASGSGGGGGGGGRSRSRRGHGNSGAAAPTRGSGG